MKGSGDLAKLFSSMEKIMKIRILAALIVASAIAAPAFAGTDAPALTRAQVHAELVQLQAAGYDQSRGEDANCPVEIPAAEARVAAQSRGSGAYGGVSIFISTVRRRPNVSRSLSSSDSSACVVMLHS